MFKQFIIAAAVCGALSSGVAMAKEDAPAVAAAPAAPQSAKTRYCIKAEPVTGTMLQPTSCKTLKQWKALGIDPTKKTR